MESAEALLQALLVDPQNEDLAMQLLHQLHEGGDEDVVVRLLQHGTAKLAELGAWLASELGSQCAAIYPDVVLHLRHPCWRVRFWLIDCVLACAGEQQAADLATATRLLDDENSAVRWKAMQFLARASTQQLEFARDCLSAQRREADLVRGVSVLADADAGNYDEILPLIHHERALLRKLGGVAAVRARRAQHHLLDVAMASDDEEVRSFAKDWL